MHGDFFHGNILCGSPSTVAGLVDWDDSQYGPLITELAAAVWEFACTPSRDTLEIGRMREFPETYVDAGGPVQPSQDIVPLIRLRLRSSIAFFRSMQALGHDINQDNERATLAAFSSLHDLNRATVVTKQPSATRPLFW